MIKTKKQKQYQNNNNIFNYEKTKRYSNGMRKITITDRDICVSQDTTKASKHNGEKSSINSTDSIEPTMRGMSSSGNINKKRGSRKKKRK